MQISNPFFSIVIPTYNRGHLLFRTLQSIKAQCFSSFEVLIVDDGSTDNTRSIVEEMICEEGRIKYLYQVNAERGAARNAGIRQAHGDFVLFIDSDDEMKSDYLQLLHEGINCHPGFNFYAAKYKFLRNGKEYNSSIMPFKQGAYGVNIVLKGNPFACNFCIRRNNPQLVLFDEDRSLATSEDWMFLVANLKKDRIFILDQEGLYMHQHDDRSMQQNGLIIDRRLRATDLLDKSYSWSEPERRTLWGYTFYFCSIHAYLDYDRRKALQYLGEAVKRCGWPREFFIAFAKYLVGKSMVNRMVSLTSIH